MSLTQLLPYRLAFKWVSAKHSAQRWLGRLAFLHLLNHLASRSVCHVPRSENLAALASLRSGQLDPVLCLS